MSIFDDLQVAITKYVKDEDAIPDVYYDVAEPFWLFDMEDVRNDWAEIPDTLPKPLVDAIMPTVKYNLRAMLEVGELPAGTDIDSLVAPTTYKLIGHVVTWDQWLPVRRFLEDGEYQDYLDEMYESIYEDEDYGLLDNQPSTTDFSV